MSGFCEDRYGASLKRWLQLNEAVAWAIAHPGQMMAVYAFEDRLPEVLERVRERLRGLGGSESWATMSRSRYRVEITIPASKEAA
jgi:hypothetical protein